MAAQGTSSLSIAMDRCFLCEETTSQRLRVVGLNSRKDCTFSTGVLRHSAVPERLLGKIKRLNLNRGHVAA